jgi:hypothetical protein
VEKAHGEGAEKVPVPDETLETALQGMQLVVLKSTTLKEVRKYAHFCEGGKMVK